MKHHHPTPTSIRGVSKAKIHLFLPLTDDIGLFIRGHLPCFNFTKKHKAYILNFSLMQGKLDWNEYLQIIVKYKYTMYLNEVPQRTEKQFWWRHEDLNNLCPWVYSFLKSYSITLSDNSHQPKHEQIQKIFFLTVLNFKHYINLGQWSGDSPGRQFFSEAVDLDFVGLLMEFGPR